MFQLMDRVRGGVDPMIANLESYIVITGLDDMKASADTITSVSDGDSSSLDLRAIFSWVLKVIILLTLVWRSAALWLVGSILPFSSVNQWEAIQNVSCSACTQFPMLSASFLW